eukprot:TRINITY_DN16275_c0_g1_i2.p1 TRINITY_DN16275_c0_g1~~TRINITY_DN16275_c0_g1_i2.p1  ORF type:complete len:683 (+),score=183.09 TRINITY_DN16275_c0_g1_i2:114-2162(+)
MLRSLVGSEMCIRDRSETLEQLLVWMTRPDVDHPKAKLYAKKSAEVLLCEVSAITKAIVSTPDHVNMLLGFLDQPPTGDIAGDLALAGHFCRMLVILANSYPEETLEALSASSSDLFQKLLGNLSMDSFKDMLAALLLAHVDDPAHLIACWLWETTVLEDMLKVLSNTADMSMHTNVSELLREIMEQRPQALTELSRPENMKMLISLLETLEDDNKIANVFNVLSGLVVQGNNAVDEFDLSPSPDCDPNLAGLFGGVMETLVGILQNVPDTEVAMPIGPLRPVLGRMRLRCVEFIALVVRAFKTGSAAETLHACMLEHKVLPQIIRLLFEHPWHNILHVHIDDIIQHCLYSTNDQLRIALIDQAQLHTRLAEALKLCVPPSKAEEDEEPATEQPTATCRLTVRQRGTSPGNMGCVIALAQALSEAAGNHDCLKSRLEADEEWGSVVGVLEEELRAQSVELGCSDPLPEQFINGDSSSEDEHHYIHHSSSDEEDGDDPFHGTGVQNRMADAFATADTTFHDDTDAWSSQPISENGDWTTSSDWGGFADSAGDNAVHGEPQGTNDFSLVEDPWADQAPEEMAPDSSNNAGWAENEPSWSNFGGGEVSSDSGPPVWNACFEGPSEAVEGEMIEPGCEDEVAEGVDADLVPEEVQEEEEVPVEEEVDDPGGVAAVPEEEQVNAGDV